MSWWGCITNAVLTMDQDARLAFILPSQWDRGSLDDRNKRVLGPGYSPACVVCKQVYIGVVASKSFSFMLVMGSWYRAVLQVVA